MFFLATGYCLGQLDSYVWDCGKIKQGEVAAHNFTLKNDSAKALKITGVTTSCGCTVSEVKKKVLLPGESTPVEIKFNSKGYSGAVQQFTYVNTDNVDKPVIRFIIKADVVK
ncbi:MAG: DUF1573 domain-containing protein [Candidatus Omnitrophota bacterium]|jgi:hypothetical protein